MKTQWRNKTTLGGRIENTQMNVEAPRSRKHTQKKPLNGESV
jgi:hypothetical protein